MGYCGRPVAVRQQGYEDLLNFIMIWGSYEDMASDMNFSDLGNCNVGQVPFDNVISSRARLQTFTWSAAPKVWISG